MSEQLQFKSIFDEAEELVNGAREDYGHPSINLKRCADAWSAYLSVRVTPHDVANMMILLKAMRAREGYHRDTATDIAGYALVDSIVSSTFFIGEERKCECCDD